MADGDPYLAQQRARYFQEMESNPALKSKVLSLLMHENGGHPEGPLEAMMNRLSGAGGGSVDSAVHGGFYGPINRGVVGPISQSQYPQAAAAYDRVRAGSNDIDLRSDQGMSNEHKWADSVADQGRGRKALINGEYYSDMSGAHEKWANQTRAMLGQPPSETGQAPAVPPPDAGDASNSVAAADRRVSPDVQSKLTQALAGIVAPSSDSGNKMGAVGSDPIAQMADMTQAHAAQHSAAVAAAGRQYSVASPMMFQSALTKPVISGQPVNYNPFSEA